MFNHPKEGERVGRKDLWRMEQSEFLEIANNSFYFKKESDCQECQFAYIHLSENAHEIYLAYFVNREVEKPIVYWWEEDDYSYNETTRHFINQFIGEAYLSLYIKAGKEKPVGKPLWRHAQATNCGIPSKWWYEIENIKR